MKKLVLFGAGKIGRSFIAPLFTRAGYEVVFIDVCTDIIAALNRRGGYEVVIKSDGGDETVAVGPVRGVAATDTDKVSGELSDCDVAAVSVGLKGLPYTTPAIAQGLKRRSRPLDIILAENLRDGRTVFRGMLKEHLPSDYPLEERIGIVQSSIGKMVPFMPLSEQQRDPLKVYAEPYNTLIVDKRGFLNPLPSIEGLAPRENIEAWVDRKSYIHNFGHAAAAYIGYGMYPSAKYLYEVLDSEAVHTFTRQAMRQSAAILKAKYPDEFTDDTLNEHIDDLLMRFANRALGDTIFRVGCDLKRKLHRSDRVLSPLLDGLEYGLDTHYIQQVFVQALGFRATDENGRLFPEDADFIEVFHKKGRPAVLREICCLDPVKDKKATEMLLAE